MLDILGNRGRRIVSSKPGKTTEKKQKGKKRRGEANNK